MDVLYARLEQAGIGCHIGSIYFGMIGYADDIILLATSILALNRILKTCAEFGSEFDVTYNATKSKFIVFGSSKDSKFDGKVVLSDQELKRVEEIDFLGNAITSDVSESADVKAKTEDLFARVNTLKFSLAGSCYEVLSKLFTVKCAHAYGSETWLFSDNSTKRFWSAYGQGARRLLGVPPSCPTTVIESIVRVKGAPHATMKKFLNLVDSMDKSCNLKIKFIFDNAMADARSVIRKNLAFIDDLWGNHGPPSVDTDDNSELTRSICQLLKAREGRVDIGLSSEDIDERMLQLCMR